MSEPVVKQITLTAPAGETTQPVESADEWTPDSGLTPPEDLERLAKLTTIARLRRSCIEAVVQNTVGLGWRVAPVEGQEEEVKDDDVVTVTKRLDELARRDLKLKRPSFKRLLKAAKWDEQEVGNGYIEVSRNRVTGEIDGLFHAPGKRIRRKSDGTGWIMGPKNGTLGEATHFYDFGEKVQYDADGKPQALLKDPHKMLWDRNELIAFQVYTSESREYGLPCDVNLALDYAADKLAAESNLSFFGASGVPPTVFFIGMDGSAENEDVELEIDPSYVAQIANTMAPQGDRKKSVAVLAKPTGASVDYFGLSDRSERDMGFVDYRRDVRRAILAAWRLSPIFVADIEDTNYSTAEIERMLTKEQKFDPEQEEWEDKLTQTILREISPALSLSFNEIEIETGDVRKQSANDAADRGEITNGEYRRAHGLEPMPEAADGTEPKSGEVPNGWNAELIEIGGGGSNAAAQPPSALQSGIEAAAQLVSQVTPEPAANGAGVNGSSA